MGSHTTYTSKTTGWKSPGTVAQRTSNVNSGTCYSFSNLDNIKNQTYSSTTSKGAYISTSGGVNTSHASPVIYAYNFGFSSIIPSNAIIVNVQIKIVCSKTTTSGGVEHKLCKFRVESNNTNTGWGNNLVNGENWSATKGALNTKTVTNENTLSTSTVRSSAFGAVYQCTGTSSNWAQPTIYYIAMNVSYKVPVTTWVDPIYTMNVSLDKSEIMDDGSVKTRLTIKTTNTNNESGTLSAVTVTITNKNKFSFSDGSFTKTIAARSKNAGAVTTDTFDIVGFEAGTDTLKVTCGSLSATKTITVAQSVTEPNFEAVINLEDTVKKYGSISLTLQIDETNDFPGTLSNITLTSNEYVKFLDNNQLVNEVIIPATEYKKSESKIYNFNIQGVSEGEGIITIISNDFGNITKNINVTGPDPVINIACDCPNLIGEEEEVEVTYTITNVGEVTANLSTLVLTTTNTLRVDDSTSKTITIDSELLVDDEITETVIVKGLAIGECVLSAVLTGFSQISNNILVDELAEYEDSFSLNVSTVNKGKGFVLTGEWTNTNSKAGQTPTLTIQLPSNVITFDGQSSYTFKKQNVDADESITQSVQLISLTAGEKTITVGDDTLTILVNDVVSEEPVLSDVWCYISNSTVYPTSGTNTGVLTIKYLLLNDVECTIPPTTITIAGNGIKINNMSNVVYPAQTFNSHGEITQNYTYSWNNENEENIITITNDLLGTKSFKVKSIYNGAGFFVIGNVAPSTLFLSDESMVNLTIKTSNQGDKTDTCTNTIVLNGGVLSFDKTSIVSSKKLATNSISVGGIITETIPIYAKEIGTGSIIITNDKTNFITNPSLVTVNTPPDPIYNYSINVVNYRLPAWTGDETTETTQVKVTITNTNKVAGTTEALKIVLDTGLTFTNGSSEYIIPSQNLAAGETKTIILPNKVKSAIVSSTGYTIHLRDTDEMDVNSCTVIITNPTPTNKGWVELKNCQFNNNVSSKGTVYNEGKIVKTTNYFNNNSSTNCPNIWNNGVCEQ